MQKTSVLYKELLAGTHTVQTRVAIGDAGRLVSRSGDYITFGGVRILTGSAGADGGYDESVLATVNTKGGIFDGDEPMVGACVSQEVDIKMLKPFGRIDGLSRISVYARLTDGRRFSEWLPQGVYYIDSVDDDDTEDGDVRWLRIHGYDALLFAEQDYPAESGLSWPAKDIDVVREIAAAIGVTIDERTTAIMTAGYMVEYPVYSCREVLGYIAAMYAGSFIMSEHGELRLVCFWDIPNETNYLVDARGAAITFGGVRILV